MAAPMTPTFEGGIASLHDERLLEQHSGHNRPVRAYKSMRTLLAVRREASAHVCCRCNGQRLTSLCHAEYVKRVCKFGGGSRGV